jgi:hypothetical protein
MRTIIEQAVMDEGTSEGQRAFAGALDRQGLEEGGASKGTRGYPSQT